MLKESLQLPAAILAMLTLTGVLVVAFTPPPVAPLAPGSTPPTPYTGTYAASLYIPTPPPSDCGDWQRFASEAELRARLAVLYPYPMMMDGGATWWDRARPPTAELSDTMAGSAQTTSTPTGAPPDYTGTNVQVVGVDEPDIVKTDGWYVYTVGPGGVTILRAYPLSELAVVSTISLEGAWPSGIFVNGNYLVILASGYGGVYAVGGDTRESFAPYYYEPSTTVLVYDISNPSRPALAANLTMSGYQVGARMIGNEVFVVSTYWMYLYDGNITLPTLTVDGTVHTVAATDIGYFPEAHNSSSVTEVLVFNLTHPKDAHMTALLADAGSTLYMSRDSIYLVGYGSRFSASTDTWVDASTLHRLYLWKGKVSCAVTGEIAGHVLNQYSLDEFDGHLRVATTEWTDGRQTANHVIILDGSLKMTGSIDDLAPGETIQAVRFLGERGYVVTFRQVDPFFVVDLKDPAAPKVLGELKITGFSQYLHPVGVNLILGIGPETTAPDSTGRTQRVGLKLSLFDVADVAHPIEKSKFVIEGSYVSSAVQWDAHALLWVPGRSLLAIPVDIYEYSWGDSWDYATSSYWQGVYVFLVTPLSGIQLAGRVAHDDAVEKSAYGYYGVSPIRRALQVGEYLYTVSDTTLQVHGIDSLQVVGHIKFWSPPPYTGYGPVEGTGGVSSPGAM